jgi:hypothetical protein
MSVQHPKKGKIRYAVATGRHREPWCSKAGAAAFPFPQKTMAKNGLFDVC